MARSGEGIDLKDLRYFLAVYEAKGFSSAAKSLGTVQSNVSSRIIDLETSVGGPLFERRWRSLVPTERGEKFYSCAKQVIAALDRTERTFKVPRAA